MWFRVKALCAELMAVYAFHPVAALALNVAIFFARALLYSKALRCLRFFRETLLAPVIAKLGLDAQPKFGGAAGAAVRVFNRGDLGPFSAKERLWMTRTEGGYLLTRKKVLRPQEQHVLRANGGEIRSGWLTHTIEVEGEELLLSRVWTPHLPAVAEAFGLAFDSEEAVAPKAAPELA